MAVNAVRRFKIYLLANRRWDTENGAHGRGGAPIREF
jgi:hypothetical protein